MGEKTLRKLTILLACAFLESWPASIIVGPGRNYKTVKSAILALLPLEDDLNIYVEMPTGSYSVPESILPDGRWNGRKVKVTGLKWAPEITGYIGNEVVLDWNGDEVLPTAYNLLGQGGAVEGHITPEGTRRAYFKDHLGSTRMTVGDAGQIHEASTFSAYGKEYWLVQPSGDNTREKFTGKEFDSEGTVGADAGVNLFYFGARYYDPDIGMWISPDPMRQFHSPYAYGPGDPINGIDPNGMLFEYDDSKESFQGLLSYVDCALNCASDNRDAALAIRNSETTFRFGPLPAGAPSDALGRFNPNTMTFELGPRGFSPEPFTHEVKHSYDWDILGIRWGSSAPLSLEARGLHAGFLEVEKRGSGTLFPGLYEVWKYVGRDPNKLGPDIPKYHKGYMREIQSGSYYNDY